MCSSDLPWADLQALLHDIKGDFSVAYTDRSNAIKLGAAVAGAGLMANSPVDENFQRYYVGHLKSQFGEIGDLRLTVMAAIMVMDELSEAKRRAGELERELDTMRQHRDDATSVVEKSDQALAGMLTELPSQVRSIADKLNGQSPA